MGGCKLASHAGLVTTLSQSSCWQYLQFCTCTRIIHEHSRYDTSLHDVARPQARARSVSNATGLRKAHCCWLDRTILRSCISTYVLRSPCQHARVQSAVAAGADLSRSLSPRSGRQTATSSAGACGPACIAAACQHCFDALCGRARCVRAPGGAAAQHRVRKKPPGWLPGLHRPRGRYESMSQLLDSCANGCRPCAGTSAVSEAEAAANEKRREEAGGVGSSDEWWAAVQWAV
jgi:hypothetical protein